jgi:hypothetical protein
VNLDLSENPKTAVPITSERVPLTKIWFYQTKKEKKEKEKKIDTQAIYIIHMLWCAHRRELERGQ